jgi:hypothetical protein
MAPPWVAGPGGADPGFESGSRRATQVTITMCCGVTLLLPFYTEAGRRIANAVVRIHLLNATFAAFWRRFTRLAVGLDAASGSEYLLPAEP